MNLYENWKKEYEKIPIKTRTKASYVRDKIKKRDNEEKS